MKFKTIWFLALLIAPAVALMLAAGCGSPPQAAVPPSPSQQAITPSPANSFVGNEACAECHKEESQKHRNSFHAATAHSVADLGKIVFPEGDVLGSKCWLRPEGNTFKISVGDSSVGAQTLDFGLGSGKTGITFVALNGGTSLFEMRASYFPKIHKWYRTPGQERLAADEMGLDYPIDRSRLCISCHSTTLPEYSVAPDPKFLGVGCEACHGPGGDHIAAVKANDLTHLRMEHLGSLSGEALNTLCGRCHRTPKDVMARSAALESETQRFQSFGIMKSRCFTDGDKKLSCLNCHDPHANATLNMRSYENACLKCHVGGAKSAATDARTAAGKQCPVNPKNGCIPCHMPARKIIESADLSPYAVDHFIHIPPKGSSPAPFRSL